MAIIIHLKRCWILKRIYHHTQLREGPQTVVVGGGTGISTLLRGLKQYTSNISVIITVADDGGGSNAKKRHWYFPPGDIRVHTCTI